MGSRQKSAMDRIHPNAWEGLDVGTTEGRFHATAKCAVVGCQETRRWTASSMAAPDVVKTKFRQFGWGFKHCKPVCPAHLHPRKERKEKVPMPANDASAATPLRRVTTAPAVPTPAARDERRLAFMALMDAYDDAQQRYKPGCTDSTVATEVGCSEAIVAKVREENFGPSAPPEPPEVKALREEIAALKGSAALAQSDATALRRRADEAHAMATALDARLTRLCASLGWNG